MLFGCVVQCGAMGHDVLRFEIHCTVYYKQRRSATTMQNQISDTRERTVTGTSGVWVVELNSGRSRAATSGSIRVRRYSTRTHADVQVCWLSHSKVAQS